MNKKILVSIILFLLFLVLLPNKTLAATSCGITTNVGSTQGGSGFRVNALVNTQNLQQGKTYEISIEQDGKFGSAIRFVADGSVIQRSFDISAPSGSTLNLSIDDPFDDGSSPFKFCSLQTTLQPSSTPLSNNNLPSIPTTDSGNSTLINGKCGVNGIDTAIGCVPIGSENDLIGFFLRWGIGVGGGIAFILIIMAGFQIMTSRGDPKRLQAGQELMTSAIAGLLLLIFSLVILRIIGFDILQIGAFK